MSMLLDLLSALEAESNGSGGLGLAGSGTVRVTRTTSVSGGVNLEPVVGRIHRRTGRCVLGLAGEGSRIRLARRTGSAVVGFAGTGDLHRLTRRTGRAVVGVAGSGDVDRIELAAARRRRSEDELLLVGIL